MICSFMTLTSAPDKTSRSLHQLFHVCLWRRNKTNTQRSFSNTADTKASVPFQELACIYKSSHTCKPGVKSSPTWHTSAHAKQHTSLSCIKLYCVSTFSSRSWHQLFTNAENNHVQLLTGPFLWVAKCPQPPEVQGACGAGAHSTEAHFSHRTQTLWKAWKCVQE